MIVSTAERGGTFRETFAMAEAYTEARKDHGDSVLLDELVSGEPEIDRTRAHSAEELKEHGRSGFGMRVAGGPSQRRAISRPATRRARQSRRSPSARGAPVSENLLAAEPRGDPARARLQAH
jgi:hypothetical protein